MCSKGSLGILCYFYFYNIHLGKMFKQKTKAVQSLSFQSTVTYSCVVSSSVASSDSVASVSVSCSTASNSVSDSCSTGSGR